MKLQRVNYDADEKEDRLSDLPDCIVLHIFSFLNAKQVVQTSVLSTRWYHLWKYLPTLTLISSDFNNFDNFIRFVIKFFYFRCRDPSISLHTLDFRLLEDCNEDGVSPDLLNSMLNYVVSRNVKDLRIITKSDMQLFPSCISSCHNLTSLHFFVFPKNPTNPDGNIIFPNSLNLPSLTYLNLGFVAFRGGVDHFLSFPRLNTLILYQFEILGEQNLCISSTTLAVLYIKNYCHGEWKIQLSTPNLSNFGFIGTPFQILCGSRLSSLQHVKICPEKMNYIEAPPLLLSLLHELSDIKSLTMYSNTLHVLSLVPDVLKVKLNSLRKLESLRIKVKEISKTLIEAKLAQQPARSQEEVAKLREAFKKESSSIPSKIIEFLLQNSPSSKVHIIR